YHSHGRAFYHLLFTFFFSFTDTAPPAIYTLSLHDALPISQEGDLPSPKVERAQLAAVAIWCGLQFDSQCCRGWGIPRTIPTGLPDRAGQRLQGRNRSSQIRDVHVPVHVTPEAG